MAAGAVEDLRGHGDRFDKAIGLIEAAALAPDWNWEETCEEDRELVASDN